MIDNNPRGTDPFGRIADEFVIAFRQGKRPSVEEFARRYPEHGDEIRQMLPALVLIEMAKPGDESSSHRRQAKTPAAVVPLKQLGDYQLLREIGRGGMGVVYEAQQLSLGLCAGGDRHAASPLAGPWASLSERLRLRGQYRQRRSVKAFRRLRNERQ